MPRPSFSHNPLLRVSRPVSACSRCRAAKVKCDGKLPACTACEKAGRASECSAANDQFARGKERSYVAALELRIEKLEKRLQYAKSRKASVALHDTDTTAFNVQQMDRRDSLAVIRAAIHRKAARKRENSDVNSLVSDFGFLSVNATTRDFEPTSTNMTFARLVLAATMNDTLPESPEARLPPRPVAHSIVQYYMSKVYSLFPSFSETALLTALDDLYQQDDRVIKDSECWLVYMVLAIGSTIQSKRYQDEHYCNGVEYASRAMSYADGALTPGYVTQIQSLLLLTQYAMLDPAHFDSWHLIGFTARAIVDLGFHQDPPLSSISDKSALDIRRKIFYCVYALDRAISMVHARTFSFTDDTVNVAFPQSSGSGRKASGGGPISGPQSADPALLLFQLRRAQSHWYQELYQSGSGPLQDPISYIWKMCLDMREWQESLPGTLAPEIRQLFEQELRYSYVYCIAPSARAPQITDYNRILIFEYSMAYLDTIYDIAHGVENSGFYTYHDVLRVYFMANQFLAVLRDAEEMLLSGIPVPIPIPRPGAAPAPPLPRRLHPQGLNGEDNLDRSIRCLEKVSQTLDAYGERWVDASQWRENFGRVSGQVVERLRRRKQMRDAAREQQMQYHGGGMQPQHQAALQMQNSQQPKEMRWVGVDVAQMMRGGFPPQ
ncbi:positive regulator of purine utilization [Fusarium albosuccineum]|uniref:Positive regulator of purine utilization n=1 Tax=Fusarium albosuccineum TaxID=1237068 RepID=A0A8H4P6T2_9HYPO|nr:positive regulator of purine utilization [Fusarium albosuccineum]